MISGLEPLVGENPKVLILGSILGAESLKRKEYYAFKQNRFFMIMYKYFGVTVDELNYEEKCKLLTSNGIALWDSIKECDRENTSLDSAIKNVTPNDIAGLVKAHPTIKAIITNGKKSTQVFEKHFKDFSANFQNIDCIGLNSTSPANARCNFDNLYPEWQSTLDKYLL